jgi:hypothetical protein
MHKLPEVERLMMDGITPARTLFMGILGDFASSRPTCRFTVVFDGTARDVKFSMSNVAILRSGASKTADELIFGLIRKCISNNTVVVSSDNEITNFARASSFDIMSSDTFAQMISSGTVKKNITPEKPRHTKFSDLLELKSIFEGNPIPKEKEPEKPKPQKQQAPIKPEDFFNAKPLAKNHADNVTTAKEKPARSSRHEIDEFMRLFGESPE